MTSLLHPPDAPEQTAPLAAQPGPITAPNVVEPSVVEPTPVERVSTPDAPGHTATPPRPHVSPITERAGNVPVVDTGEDAWVQDDGMVIMDDDPTGDPDVPAILAAISAVSTENAKQDKVQEHEAQQAEDEDEDSDPNSDDEGYSLRFVKTIEGAASGGVPPTTNRVAMSTENRLGQ